MPTTERFDHLTRDAIARRARQDAIALVPFGATEQHGPHLPVGTDTLSVSAITWRAAEQAQIEVPLLVTPALPFGSSHHHLPFGGTLSLRTETAYAVVCELLESLIVSGFRRAVVVNGHGGNHELAQLAVRDVALRHPVTLGAISYWHAAADHLADIVKPEIARIPGHAGHFETSLILALQADLVAEQLPAREADPSALDPDALRRQVRIERHDAWQRVDGFTDSPATASAELGSRYLAAAVTGVADAIRAFAQRTASSS